MPFGIGSSRSKSPLKFSKKKTYAVQEHQAGTPHRGGGSGKSAGGISRRNTAPAGILKRGGLRPVSYPALEDGMVPQEMAAAIPMPTEGELNELFVEMVVSLLTNDTVYLQAMVIARCTRYCCICEVTATPTSKPLTDALQAE